jgi:hypothetical protein
MCRSLKLMSCAQIWPNLKTDCIRTKRHKYLGGPQIMHAIYQVNQIGSWVVLRSYMYNKGSMDKIVLRSCIYVNKYINNGNELCSDHLRQIECNMEHRYAQICMQYLNWIITGIWVVLRHSTFHHMRKTVGKQTHNQMLEIEHNKIKIRGGSQIMSAISLHRQFKSLTSLANNVTSLNNHHHLDLNHMANHDPTVQNHRSKVLHAPVSRNLHKRGCTKVGGSRKPQKRLHSSKEGLVS